MIVISWLDTYLRTRARTKAPSYYVRPVVVCDFDRRMSHRCDIEDVMIFQLFPEVELYLRKEKDVTLNIFCRLHLVRFFFGQNNNQILHPVHVLRPLGDSLRNCSSSRNAILGRDKSTRAVTYGSHELFTHGTQLEVTSRKDARCISIRASLRVRT